MKSSEYLYGCNIEDLLSMSEGLLDRLNKASNLLNELLEVPLNDRDFHRIAAVIKSIEHNNKLLHGMV